MSRPQALLGWLEDTSDWLNPIVVKEVRQVVRGREFNYSFGVSLVAGFAVAFFGAADALTGTGAAGRWTFLALMGCLTLLGLAVVPLGAYSALRNERMEQTLELITLTALSPRRVVIGKLLAQGVKLATLFAGMAPFIAMSFLLGGIDFVTILVTLAVVFLWSLWASAACLFLSTLLKSRAISGLVFGGVALIVFIVFGFGRAAFFFFGGASFAPGPISISGADSWWALAIVTTACLATMINLVLLAENRLSLATEDRVTPLRVGFLVQFLLIAAWTLSFIGEPPTVRASAAGALRVIGGLHLALVAMFAVTEDLPVPRTVLRRMQSASAWRRMLAILGPGGGRGAIYVLAQMALLVAASWLLDPRGSSLRWLLTMCGYVCFFTGVPAFLFQILKPSRGTSLHLRLAVLLLLPASMVLPDLIHYLLWRPEVLDLKYSARHLLNPLRTLANWRTVETRIWFVPPLGLGLIGLITYLRLIQMGMQASKKPAYSNTRAVETGSTG